MRLAKKYLDAIRLLLQIKHVNAQEDTMKLLNAEYIERAINEITSYGQDNANVPIFDTSDLIMAVMMLKMAGVMPEECMSTGKLCVEISEAQIKAGYRKE